MTPDMLRFTEGSRANPKAKYTSLMGMLFRPEGLLDSYKRQPRKKAAGVDGISKEDYGKGLEERLNDLSGRIRRLGYVPKPSRRMYIPKANGGVRPLGIPSFEDRIVQGRMSDILMAIWEPEFRDCSYGFRPGRSAHEALHRIAEVITNEGTQWIVEADIKGFFNNVHHEHLMRFLEHRIKDKLFLRVIWRFLKAGVMEDGVFQCSDLGTPQGGLISPVLSNIYLHYVLDWWFEGKFAKTCGGKAYLIRYADDYVACFQKEGDARRFAEEMKERLAQFALEVEPSKTAIVRFGNQAAKECRKDGIKRPLTFNFLGFTHYAGKSRTGRFVVGRSTDRKRMTKKLKELSQKMRRMREEGGAAMVEYMKQHLRGYNQYYGVSGNGMRLNEYFYWAMRILYKWLNRRSQRRSMTWAKYWSLIKAGLLPKARIIHNLYPKPAWMT